MPRTAPGLTIGALAERTGCNPPTIRYYEEIGLLPRPGRRASGHRTYGDEDLRRLTFIRRCRDFGFPVEQVRALVALTEAPDRDCAEARDVAQAHLDAVREKLAELQALECTLASFVDSCTTACAGGPAGQCTILEDLATPAASRRVSCCG
jgi:MerR family copper efflux transcriptional regulator